RILHRCSHGRGSLLTTHQVMSGNLPHLGGTSARLRRSADRYPWSTVAVRCQGAWTGCVCQSCRNPSLPRRAVRPAGRSASGRAFAPPHADAVPPVRRTSAPSWLRRGAGPTQRSSTKWSASWQRGRTPGRSEQGITSFISNDRLHMSFMFNELSVSHRSAEKLTFTQGISFHRALRSPKASLRPSDPYTERVGLWENPPPASTQPMARSLVQGQRIRSGTGRIRRAAPGGPRGCRESAERAFGARDPLVLTSRPKMYQDAVDSAPFLRGVPVLRACPVCPEEGRASTCPGCAIRITSVPDSGLFTPELVDAVIAEHSRAERRRRILPARLVL
ncbi:hypothetical protein P3T27_007900, partial [Kitasatospora sp. MAA19]|nr:hypothetical protein [Kitasatospora sp. MAA19]